jgi:plastocyanin
MSLRAKLAVLVPLACLVLLPAAAQARTKTVFMGTPASAIKTFENKLNSDANDFFLHTVTIHVGDTIAFREEGFHSVDIPPRGGKRLALSAPTGQTIAGVNDAGGNPFWFNGRPARGADPAVATVDLFGKRATYNGTKRVESGIPQAERPKPLRVKFTKAGTYRYFCNVHARMRGVIRVRPRGKRIPSAKADAKALKKQIAAALKVAKGLAATKPPAGTVYVGAGGKGGVENYAFFPSTLTVAVGTTLRFEVSPKSYDIHTASTGPGNPEQDPNSYLAQLSASFQSPTPRQEFIYPSDPPGTSAGLTPTFHGNGFWSTGMITNGAGTEFGTGESVTFAGAGTYQFYCLIHPFMHATVTAQ